MKKQSWIALLICLNAALLCGILLASYSMPAAYAQGTGLAGNYLAVTGEVQDQYDALYVVDMRNHILHAFVYDRGKRALEYTASRRLSSDFRND